MHILLVNDDGYKGLGIQVLADTLYAAGHRVTVVAPAEECSGKSHAVSYSQSLLVEQKQKQPFAVYSVNGMPADCTIVGLEFLLQKNKPDLVISGINNGFNAGIDVNVSGTVGAATQACFSGIKAIAVSADTYHLDIGKPEQKVQATLIFQETAALVADIVQQISILVWPVSQILNINYPYPCKGIRHAICGNTSLFSNYVLCTKEWSTDSGRSASVEIAGNMKTKDDILSEDTYWLLQNIATMSFLQAKQSSTGESATSIDMLVQTLQLSGQ
jgi:5'-nucleotidase